MSRKDSRAAEITAWIVAASWVLLIFATIPFIRHFQTWVAARYGPEIFGYATVAVLGAGAVFAVRSLFLLSSRPRWPRFLWLMLVTVTGLWWTRQLWARPEEAVHLVEYGLLALVLSTALGFRLQSWVVFPVTILLGTIVGCVDELIQWVTPGRFFDFRDIWINGGACSLAAIAVWKGIPARSPRKAATSHEVRTLLRTGIILSIMLTVFFSATPRRTGSIDGWIPWFDIDHQDVIVEYGYRHDVPGIGRFSSRFTLPDLEARDRQFSAETASALSDSRRRYGEFLKRYHPGRTPFAYEARVHFFSRNRNINLALKSPGREDLYRRHMSLAQGEDRVIASFFATTERLAGFELPKRRRTLMEKGALPDFDFESRVAAHLITRLDEPTLRTLMLGLIGLLVGADVYLGIRSRRQARKSAA